MSGAILLVNPLEAITPMRGVNRLLELQELAACMKGLKQFTRSKNLYLNDFNVLVGVMYLSKQPTANSRTAASVPSLTVFLSDYRLIIEQALKRLIKGGYVVRRQRTGATRGRALHFEVNTYHLTKAGRDLINSYYESEFCKLKR